MLAQDEKSRFIASLISFGTVVRPIRSGRLQFNALVAILLAFEINSLCRAAYFTRTYAIQSPNMKFKQLVFSSLTFDTFQRQQQSPRITGKPQIIQTTTFAPRSNESHTKPTNLFEWKQTNTKNFPFSTFCLISSTYMFAIQRESTF